MVESAGAQARGMRLLGLVYAAAGAWGMRLLDPMVGAARAWFRG